MDTGSNGAVQRHMSTRAQFQGAIHGALHFEMIAYARSKGFSVGFTNNATLWNEIIDF
jgi:hypothetical protein